MLISFDGFDIVIDLTAIGSAYANNSPYYLAIYMSHEIKYVSNWGQCNHPCFSIVSPIIKPDECCYSFEISCGG